MKRSRTDVNSQENPKKRVIRHNETSETLHNLQQLTPESIQIMLEASGVLESSETQLKPDAAKEISTRLTDFLHRLLQDSYNISCKNGHSKLLVADVNMALQYNGVRPCYGAEDLPCRPSYRSLKMGAGREIFVKNSLEFLPVDSGSESHLSLHHDVILGAHWLLLDNKQPTVPENPLNVFNEILSPRTQPAASEFDVKQWPGGNAAVSNHLQVLPYQAPHPLVKKVIDLRENKPGTVDNKTHSDSGSALSNIRQARKLSKQKLKLPQVTIHHVDLEMQLYYTDLTEAIVGTEDMRRSEAFESLHRDPSIQPLIPFLVTFACEGIRMCLLQQNMFELFSLIKALEKLCDNETVHLQEQLYLLVPSLLSCCVCKQLCLRPLEMQHCKLRSFASKCLAKLCMKYQTLEPEVIRDVAALCGRVLLSYQSGGYSNSYYGHHQRQTIRNTSVSGIPMNDISFSLSSVYGAFVLLCDLGVKVVKEVLLPVLPGFAERVYEIFRPSATGPGVSTSLLGGSNVSLASSTGNTSVSPTDSQVAGVIEKEFHERLAPIIAEIRRGNSSEKETLEQYRQEFGFALGNLLHTSLVLGRGPSSSIRMNSLQL